MTEKPNMLYTILTDRQDLSFMHTNLEFESLLSTLTPLQLFCYDYYFEDV